MTDKQIDSEGFVKAQPKSLEPSYKVTVTDIDISFGSMIGIMFKAFFAAIIVSLYVGAVGFVLAVLLMGFVQQFHR